VVFLWAHGRGPHLAGLFADLPRPRPGCRWIVGGPGWADQELPAGVPRCASLDEAADQVQRAG